MKFAFIVAITAALLYALLRNVNMRELRDSMTGIDRWLLLGSIAANLAALFLRTLRWQVILEPVKKKLSLFPLFESTTIGFMASALLPARLGELVRPLLLARRADLPAPAAIASVVLERAIDFFTILAFYIFYAFLERDAMSASAEISATARLLRLSGYAGLIAIAVGVAILVAVVLRESAFLRLCERFISWLPERPRRATLGLLQSFLGGLGVLRRFGTLVVTAILSIGIWMLLNLQTWLVLLALHLDLPYRTTFLLSALGLIGLAIPTPGGVGGFHKAIQIGLTYFHGVPLAAATSAAIVVHAVAFLPATVIGLGLLPSAGLSFSRLRQIARAVPPPVGRPDDA